MAGKVAILTGAGKGMGAAIARELAATGYTVALMSPSGSAEVLGKELGGLGLRGSNAEQADLARLVDATMTQYGRIDAVATSTGHAPKGGLLAIPDEDWAKGHDLILMHIIRMVRLVTPIMLKQGKGAIVNISTYAALEPDPAFPVSCTYRAALASFTKLYADEHAAKGIRMNNILPGFIDSLPANEKRVAQIPMKRYGTTAEIAKTAAFLLSDGAGYITGQNIRVDGGVTRSV
jgi:NAD(P)-dependent dehydrogenase (short-subunit alcohol dehydrogenase family)